MHTQRRPAGPGCPRSSGEGPPGIEEQEQCYPEQYPEEYEDLEYPEQEDDPAPAFRVTNHAVERFFLHGALPLSAPSGAVLSVFAGTCPRAPVLQGASL